MNVSFVVAMTTSGVMGKNNTLPWHLPEDLKHFKSVTLGKPIVMGRKTYDSIGKPLPGRRNVVISRQKDLSITGVEVFNSLNDALMELQKDSSIKEVCIIGGAEIFKNCFSLANTLHITWIHKDFEGDVIFPVSELSSFELVEKDEHMDHQIPHAFCVYKKS